MFGGPTEGEIRKSLWSGLGGYSKKAQGGKHEIVPLLSSRIDSQLSRSRQKLRL